MSEATERIDQILEREGLRAERIEIDPASPTPGFDYLCATVRDGARPHHERARAARELLPFEKPKLSAAQLVHYQGDMAERLDRAIERSNAARIVNDGNAKLIDHDPSEGQKVSAAQAKPAGVRRL